MPEHEVKKNLARGMCQGDGQLTSSRAFQLMPQTLGTRPGVVQKPGAVAIDRGQGVGVHEVCCGSRSVVVGQSAGPHGLTARTTGTPFAPPRRLCFPPVANKGIFMAKPDLVVFSHLRWNFEHQRSQHLLGRLARHWNITFIEEPIYREGPTVVEVEQPMDSLRVLVPRTPVAEPGFHDAQLALLQPLVNDWLTQQGIARPMVWLSTPMALPLAQALDPLCLVYDCMDELGALKDAPCQLGQRERVLMQQAALVLAGGPSLFEARRRLNPNVHCLPGSVDAAHFSVDRLDHSGPLAQDVREQQGHLRAPRLGYFGLIDERLDLALLALLADAHKEWQIVMVGPVVKLDPATLPRRSNLHWLGTQTYPRLPYFLSGWDLCLLPFALKESTRFISPTNTLEYMAGDKPVVSTAVNDVVAMYSVAVEIVYSRPGFVRACERLLTASETSREARSNQMASLVAAGSWERSTDKVNTLLSEIRSAALFGPSGTQEPPAAQLALPFEMAEGSS